MSNDNQDANNEVATPQAESSPAEVEHDAPESPEQTDEVSSTADEGKSPEGGNVPFHEHPRFQALYQEKKELAERVAEMERSLSESQRLAAMDPKERKILEDAKKYGLVTKHDLDDFKRESVKMKRAAALQDFVSSTPAAAGMKDVINDLSLLPSNKGKSFQEIYNSYIGSKGGKIVSRTVRTGIRPKTGSSKSAPSKFSPEAVKKMTPKEYEANRPAIMKQMQEEMKNINS